MRSVLLRAVSRLLDALTAGRGWLLGGMALVCLALGTVGFSRYANGVDRSLANSVYQSAQLFFWAFWHGPSDAVMPWQIEVSRWLAPLVTASALFTVVGSFLRHAISGAEVQAIRHLSGHSIVIGLGRKGLAAVNGFLATGETVVVVERDADNPSARMLREQGVLVVCGEGGSADALLRAGAARSSRIIVVCDSDVSNIRIAAAVRRFIEEHRRPGSGALVVAVQVSDVRMAEGVRDAWGSLGDEIRLECIDAQSSGIAMLLNEFPLPDEPDTQVALLGAGELASTFLCMAEAWNQMRGDGQPRCHVSVVAPDASAFLASHRARYPALIASRWVSAVDTPITPARHPDWLPALRRLEKPQSVVYVMADSDDETVSSALFATRAVRDQNASRIVAVLRDPEAYADVLGPTVDVHPLFGTLLDAEIAMGGTVELLARAIHERYVSLNAPRGTGSSMARLEWAEMDDSQRARNRGPASDIPHKLAAIGYRMMPVAEWGPVTRGFQEQERQTLAMMEHERWIRFTESQGYVFGPDRVDNGPNKTHPDLVPWDALTEAARLKDYESIDQIPELLLMIGYRMERLTSSHIATDGS